MQIIKANAAFDQPRERLKNYFSRGNLYFSRDTHLCFVCGAAYDKDPTTGDSSLRGLFIDHVRNRADDKLVCVRAETAATELLRQLDERGQNISIFEHTIADTVDSVLIFPESPGSFAELGYFSAHEVIAKKSLVAVRTEHQSNSFITLGPIHAISKASQFSPIPIALANPPANQMSQIVERLLGESSKKRSYRERFEQRTWKDYNSRHQLAILDEIIYLMGATTEPDILNVIKLCFGPYDVSKVRLQLSILVATGRITRNDDADIFAQQRAADFIDSAVKAEKLEIKAAWRSAFENYDPDTISQLEKSHA